jgi:hypothetical protein
MIILLEGGEKRAESGGRKVESRKRKEEEVYNRRSRATFSKEIY